MAGWAAHGRITKIRDGVELIRAIKRMGSLGKLGLICVGIVATTVIGFDQAIKVLRAWVLGH